MATPSNTTPLLATNITSTSFSITISEADMAGVPQGTGYPSTCDVNQYAALWWKYTTRTDEFSIAISVDGTVPGQAYAPTISVWTGPSIALLAQVKVVGGLEPSDFCIALNGDWYQVPVNPNQVYYFQVTDGAGPNSPLGGGMSFAFEGQAILDVSEGALFINDDADGYPGAIINQSAATFDRFIPFPAGEFADWVRPSGIICTQSGDGNSDTVAFMRPNGPLYEEIVSVVLPNPGGGTTIVRGIRSNKTDTFWVLYTEAVDPGPVVTMYCRAFTEEGVFIREWTLPTNAVVAAAMAVNREGTILYYAKALNNEPIHRYDLENDTALSDLAGGVAGERPGLGFSGDGFVDTNGDVFIGYQSNVAPFETPTIRRYSSAGTLLQTYLVASGLAVKGNHLADSPDGTSFWVWLLPTGAQDRAWFRQIRISDGVALQFLGPMDQITQSGGPNEVPFAHSNSCPLIIMPVSLPLRQATTQAIRRLRRFPLPFDRSLWVFISRIEFLIQAGMGLSPNPDPTVQGVDPTASVRFSTDGGLTWGDTIYIPLGAQGEYQLRPVINQIGQMRNGICEISTTDPVFAYLLDCFLDADVAYGG